MTLRVSLKLPHSELESFSVSNFLLLRRATQISRPKQLESKI